jgi:hypothetical protein
MFPACVCVCGSTVCTPPLSCSLQAIANDDDAPPPVPSCCMYCPHALPITDAQLRASSATVPRCLWNDVRGSCSPLQLLYLALEPPTPTTLWHKCGSGLFGALLPASISPDLLPASVSPRITQVTVTPWLAAANARIWWRPSHHCALSRCLCAAWDDAVCSIFRAYHCNAGWWQSQSIATWCAPHMPPRQAATVTVLTAACGGTEAALARTRLR